MATYDFVFDGLGLRDWCTGGGESSGPMSMAELTGKAQGSDGAAPSAWDLPFPSLDALNDACQKIPQSREMTKGLEEAFLGVKDALKFVLDPLTQPLSWMLDGALWAML